MKGCDTSECSCQSACNEILSCWLNRASQTGEAKYLAPTVSLADQLRFKGGQTTEQNFLLKAGKLKVCHPKAEMSHCVKWHKNTQAPQKQKIPENCSSTCCGKWLTCWAQVLRPVCEQSGCAARAAAQSRGSSGSATSKWKRSRENQKHAELLCERGCSPQMSETFVWYPTRARGWTGNSERGRWVEVRGLLWSLWDWDLSTQFKPPGTTTDLAGFTTTPCFSAKLHLPTLTWPVCDWTVSSMVVRGMGSEKYRPRLKKPSPGGGWLYQWKPKHREIKTTYCSTI